MIDRIEEIVGGDMTKRLEEDGYAAYASMEMKTGICASGLSSFSAAAVKFMRLDPRGGYFREQHVHDGVKRVAMKSEHAESLKAFQEKHDIKDPIHFIAYKYRVVLSHFRIKFDNWCALKSKDSNADIYIYMTQMPYIRSACRTCTQL